MSPLVKDYVDVLTKLAGLATVVVGFFALRLQLTKQHEDRVGALDAQLQATQQRKEELRWRRANLAREMVSDLLHDGDAQRAMQMLDWRQRYYRVQGEAHETTTEITAEDVLRALRTENLKFSKGEMLIRDSFDAFFGHLQQIQHGVQIGLLRIEDVAYPLRYYARKMSPNLDIFRKFLTEYDYSLVPVLLESLLQDSPVETRTTQG